MHGKVEDLECYVGTKRLLSGCFRPEIVLLKIVMLFSDIMY